LLVLILDKRQESHKTANRPTGQGWEAALAGLDVLRPICGTSHKPIGSRNPGTLSTPAPPMSHELAQAYSLRLSRAKPQEPLAQLISGMKGRRRMLEPRSHHGFNRTRSVCHIQRRGFQASSQARSGINVASDRFPGCEYCDSDLGPARGLPKGIRLRPFRAGGGAMGPTWGFAALRPRLFACATSWLSGTPGHQWTQQQVGSMAPFFVDNLSGLGRS
jgi:hypothetical protein